MNAGYTLDNNNNNNNNNHNHNMQLLTCHCVSKNDESHAIRFYRATPC